MYIALKLKLLRYIQKYSQKESFSRYLYDKNNKCTAFLQNVLVNVSPFFNFAQTQLHVSCFNNNEAVTLNLLINIFSPNLKFGQLTVKIQYLLGQKYTFVEETLLRKHRLALVSLVYWLILCQYCWSPPDFSAAYMVFPVINFEQCQINTPHKKYTLVENRYKSRHGERG